MERPTMLLATLLSEIGELAGVSTARDAMTLWRRVKHEGLSFLTITLPNLDSLFLRSIELGVLQPEIFHTFRKTKTGRLPQFLGGFFSRVFNDDGVLKDTPCVESIHAIRLVCSFLKKIELDCSDQRKKAAYTSYVDIEADLSHFDEVFDYRSGLGHYDDLLCAFDQCGEILWSDLDPSIDDLVPRHGPGATAEKLSTHQRLKIARWNDQVNEHFPIEDFGIINYADFQELEDVEYGPIPPARVVQVPKTLKGPRTISVEPSFLQFLQQGVLRYLTKKLESGVLTRESLRFTDQGHNKNMARLASLSREEATLDLKDASDRVHNLLVERMLLKSPASRFILGVRNPSAKLPDGTVLRLKKYASMGSATCFPVESMMFYTAIQALIHHKFHLRPSSKTVRLFSRRISIYGDDIIIPAVWSTFISEGLSKFALRVNLNKSFTDSHFRESCGGDYYQGVDVKPIYLRKMIPSKEMNQSVRLSSAIAAVATSNQFYELGLWRTCQALRDLVLPHYLVPRIQTDKPQPEVGFRFVSRLFSTQMEWRKPLQRFGQRGIVPSVKMVKDPIPDSLSAGLFKAFPNVGNEQALDFVSIPSRGVLTPKRRWVA